jgi:DNA-binding CsgD family transcriptional regulator
MLESLDSLRPLGLDFLAETVYRQLLGNPGWDVSDIADCLRVKEMDVRRAMDRLARLSLVVQESGKMQAARPDGGLSELLDRVEADLMARQQKVMRAKVTAAVLAARWNDEFGEDSFERLHEPGAIQARIGDLAASSCFEFIVFLREENMARIIEPIQKVGEVVLERGVALRHVWESRVQESQFAVAHAQWLVLHGGQVRMAPTLPLTMAVVDREVALVPVGTPGHRQGIVQIRGTSIVTALVSLFERIWTTSLDSESSSGTDDLTKTERELLRMLGEGFTDQRAANSLRVSLRTVRRLTSGLQERLGARSRFQAGAYAARRGWLNI